MTKDSDNANWKWGWSPEIDADDERGYFQTETELCGAFLYEVIKPKLSDDVWDTLINAIHNERVVRLLDRRQHPEAGASETVARAPTLGRVLADFLVVGAIEMDDRHNLQSSRIVLRRGKR